MELTPGTPVDSVTIVVEAGKIGEFVRATGVTDLVHTDMNVANQAGFPNLLATATHCVVTGHQRDQRAFVAALGLDMSRVVVGSVEWRYERPLIVGDRLVAQRTVVDDCLKATRAGATNRQVTLETEFFDDDGTVVARQREVLIERGKA
jgi:acyl dehydratase